MKVSLECDGGLAGYRIAGMIETADLPRETAERAERLLRPDKLAERNARRHPRTTDLHVYLVGLFTKARECEEFRVEEATAPAEVLDLMAELVAEIVRRRQRRRSGRADPERRPPS